VRKLFFFFLVFLSACTLIQKKETKIEWPSRVEYLAGMGDLDMNWKGTAYSGSASVKMDYPYSLVIEVYGAFGQTLLYLKKEEGRFFFVAEEKIEEERLFEKRYGLKLVQFMDDLAMVGVREDSPEGFTIQRDDYRVVYGGDRRGRPRICWRGVEGHICLAFDELHFTKEEPVSEGSSGRR
jgi:hypothetical protein